MNTNVKKAALVSSLKAQVEQRAKTFKCPCSGSQAGGSHGHGGSCSGMF